MFPVQWSGGEKPHEVRSKSKTRVAKTWQWETLSWLAELMSTFEGKVNSSPLGQWSWTELMGKIRIKRSLEDLSSYIVKTQGQVPCCILHGSLLSTLMNGLMAALPPPPFDVSANTFPCWVIALAPDQVWPKADVDFSSSMQMDSHERAQEEEEEEEEGVATRTKGVTDRRERTAPQKNSKVKAK